MERSADQDSLFTEYVGKAAEDLPLDGVELKVIVPNLMPSLSGTFGAAESDATVTTTNRAGVAESVSVKTSNHIVATYEGASNLKYPPLVKTGEQVKVRKYGNNDKYYWSPIGRDPELRQLDRYRIEASNTPAKAEVKTDDNTYFFELNPVTGTVTVKTSQSNGEAYGYTLLINTKESVFTITDTEENRILFDSKRAQVQINNKEKTTVNLIGKSALVSALEDIVLKGERQLVFQSPVYTFENQGGDGVSVINTNGMTINAQQGFTVNSPTIGMNGATKVEGPLVSGAHRAEGYSTGETGGGYGSSTTDVSEGRGESPQNTPDNAEGGPNMRHAAAWEEVDPAFRLIVRCFDEIKNALGQPTSDYQKLIQHGIASKMPKNTGE